MRFAPKLVSFLVMIYVSERTLTTLKPRVLPWQGVCMIGSKKLMKASLKGRRRSEEAADLAASAHCRAIG